MMFEISSFTAKYFNNNFGLIYCKYQHGRMNPAAPRSRADEYGLWNHSEYLSPMDSSDAACYSGTFLVCAFVNGLGNIFSFCFGFYHSLIGEGGGDLKLRNPEICTQLSAKITEHLLDPRKGFWSLFPIRC